jgi:molybdopterin synthase catalytic subunit
VRIRALYFGALRAKLGRDAEWLDLAPQSRAQDAAVAACVTLGAEWPAALSLAVNETVVPRDTPLREGDTVALLPPVSGGLDREALEVRDRCYLSDQPLDVAGLIGLEAPDRGAVAVFVGRVRNTHQGREVSGLDYEAYPGLAMRELDQVARLARERWSLGPLVLAHRVGRLGIGDAAVVVAVSSGHRDSVFEACRFLIDALKERVPVWKHEFYADGTEAWVGAPGLRAAEAITR